MRIMVTGGRNFDDSEMLDAALRANLTAGDTLVSGTASGADRMSERWAERNGIEVERHPADWGRDCDDNCYHKPRSRNGRSYCPVAGMKRNREMVESGIDLVVAFPGGRGTANAVATAKKMGVDVVEAG